MELILVIGVSGFVGCHIVQGLLAEGHAVRSLSRDPALLHEAAGCEIVKGDISDAASIQRALDGVSAVYVSINTIVPQPGDAAGRRFMEVETAGMRDIVAACETNGVRRLINVTSLGIEPGATGEWLRERWKIQQALLASSLDVTVIRPGMICGAGGRGFGMVMSQARWPFALTMGGGRQKMRSIALGDLTYNLVGVLNEPRAYGRSYDVGCDDTFTIKEMIDIAAQAFGRKPPVKLTIPWDLLDAAAPLVERLAKMPKGAFSGLVDGMKADAVGDPMPIRAILPRPLLSFRQCVELEVGRAPR